MTFGEVFSSWNRGGVLGSAAASRTRFMTFQANTGKGKSPRMGFQAYVRNGAGTPRRNATPRREGGSDSPWHQYRPRCSSVPTTPRGHARQLDPDMQWRDAMSAAHVSPRAPPGYGRDAEAMKPWPSLPQETPLPSRPDTNLSAPQEQTTSPGYSAAAADAAQRAPSSSLFQASGPQSTQGEYGASPWLRKKVASNPEQPASSTPYKMPEISASGFPSSEAWRAARAYGGQEAFAVSEAPLPGQDTKTASFVRLNNFLLRTHITSIVSALAEDGWIEAWEKERICRCARENTSSTALAFIPIYGHFVETSDVPTFARALKANIN